MFKILATSKEKQLAQTFANNAIPVSFTYDSVPFPEGFCFSEDRYTAIDGSLVCEFPFTFRQEEAAVEWLPRFTNPGNTNTAQIRDVCALDHIFPVDGAVTLYYSDGYHATIHDFSLLYKKLERETFTLTSKGSVGHIPFFNLQTGSGGILFGLGFSDRWTASFTLVEGGVHVVVRMPETDFYMYPGESLRNILMLAIFWEGDLQRSFNRLRNYLVRYYIPKDDNGEPFPPICCHTWGGMKTRNHLKYIRFLKENDLHFDVYWMDAGWYGPNRETDEFQDCRIEDWSYHMGDWSVNRCAHPDGLTPIAEAANDAGMELLLWFAPHTANDGIGWHKAHPEWSVGYGTEEYRSKQPHGIGANKDCLTRMFTINFELPEARQWVLDELTGTIRKNSVKWYREDMGSPKVQDTPGRIGTGAMRSVALLYEFWDELRARIPGLQIDNCRGGGSRIDLETLRRSYVLWRNDYNCRPDADPIGAQVSNYGLGHFIPLVNGAPPVAPGCNYTFLSGLYGGMSFGLFHPVGVGEPEKHTWFAPDYPVEWHKQMLDVYQMAKPYLSGSFYPLTPCSTDRKAMLSYQFDRPDLNGGLIFVFFRPECTEMEITIAPVLEPGVYKITDAITGQQFILDTALKQTLTLKATEKPQGILLRYELQY